MERTPFEKKCDSISDEVDLWTEWEQEFVFWCLIPHMIERFRKDMDIAHANAEMASREDGQRSGLLYATSIQGLNRWINTLNEIRDAETYEVF